MGKGEKFKIWVDLWLEDTPLYLTFPRLFLLSNQTKIALFLKWGNERKMVGIEPLGGDGGASNMSK